MSWKIDFDPAAVRELRKLDRPVAKRILDFLHNRLASIDDPRSIGEALKGDKLGGLWRYRVGDCRIIASIKDSELQLLVIRVGHRKDVYKQ
ncbi:type II toxin-antitoxin system RelE family toxin [Desulfurispira natronophila]|uniref:mRNA interferase RelE/StbE n=1 Tax=Desulfurispira natronophila TaxID=682562 RepID=A0A7W8DHJ3_9BACT|nr:type II toxin-antitoxin system RelE/ParE family toxin [Desulfurispira natronophila]MBB5022545.1 mRNA interferase RelE/StbE [Desulfurispira natronophila]